VLVVVVLTLLAAVTNAGSSVLQRKAHHTQVRQEVHGVRGLLAALRHPVWLAGVALLPISSVLGAVALSQGQVSVVQSLQCLELPMVLVLSSLVFRHRLRWRDWVSIVVMAVGMAVFLYAMDPRAGRPDAVSTTGWLVGAGGAFLLVVVVALLGWYGGLRGRTRRAQLLGVASGMSFALAAVFISADLSEGFGWFLLAKWQTYAVLGVSAVAMLLLQWGMQAGTLVAVQPGVTLADPVVAIALGTTIFHEHVRGGIWLVPEVIAAVAIAYEVFALSRSEVMAEKIERPDLAEERPEDRPHATAPAVGPLVRRAATRWPPPDGTRSTGRPASGATASGLTAVRSARVRGRAP
jgi:drug/metabolite transporter (DMT)-like permease